MGRPASEQYLEDPGKCLRQVELMPAWICDCDNWPKWHLSIFATQSSSGEDSHSSAGHNMLDGSTAKQLQMTSVNIDRPIPDAIPVILSTLTGMDFGKSCVAIAVQHFKAAPHQFQCRQR